MYRPYTHSNDEIAWPLAKSKGLRHGKRAYVGYSDLNDVNDWDDCKIRKHARVQLRSQLRKDWSLYQPG